MAALSHDARTPLNAVVLSAKLLESQVKDQEDPEVQDCLRTIRNAVRNVLDLLSDLLDLTRIDAGATLAESSQFPLKETLAECVSGIEPQAHAKGLDVRLDAGDLEYARLETDRAKLKQILSNLLSNALRYTERGQIRVFAGRTDGRIEIGVQDTGVGIAEIDHPKIFDEFAILEHPNRVRGEGTGLGLAICRRLANLLHGEIFLKSELNKGSTFTLSLPASVLTSESTRDETPQGAPSRDFTGTILIAEDHEDSRRTMAKVLRRMGYRVLEAGNGREVLHLVRQERPMVVLMDVNMPGLDGVETTLALRSNPDFRELPILALTGDVSILNQQRIGEAGVDGYLEKPVTWEKLEAALDGLRRGLNPPTS
jgi:CheY-like chemotaxis protein/anti-sigma regulatory factor (Ser/Thr protein kinase)